MNVEQVLATERLYAPTERRISLSVENRALHALAHQMSRAPESMLLRLAHIAAEICNADSAVVLVALESGAGPIMRVEAAVGALEQVRGLVVPRSGCPSAMALDRNAPQLFRSPARVFPGLAEVAPELEELLVVPLDASSKTVGTLWVGAHGRGRSFDMEDARVLQELAGFTCAAWELISSRTAHRRVIDELQEANRRKDTFLATLSHELKNPLGAMVNALDLLKAGDCQAWALEVMRGQTEQLGHLLDDVQDMASVTQGKMRIKPRVTTAQEVVEAAVLTVTHQVEDRRHTLTVALPEAPIHLLADPPRLTQVLVNLLTNATRYTEPGGLIRIAADQQNGMVQFAISDNGPGIRPELLPRIFELYEQGETGQRHGGGLGIGLALVRGLVVLHGGSIDVRSNGDGLGSEFVVRIPQSEPPAEGSSEAGSS